MPTLNFTEKSNSRALLRELVGQADRRLLDVQAQGLIAGDRKSVFLVPQSTGLKLWPYRASRKGPKP